MILNVHHQTVLVWPLQPWITRVIMTFIISHSVAKRVTLQQVTGLSFQEYGNHQPDLPKLTSNHLQIAIKNYSYQLQVTQSAIVLDAPNIYILRVKHLVIQ